MKWRYEDGGIGTGERNMAADLDLLGKIREGEAIVRLYQWQPYCISLGKNQSSELVRTERCRLDGVDIVHRPTGGRAVLHAEELTYCVAVVEEHLGHAEWVYWRIGEILVQALCHIGVPASLARVGDDLRRAYHTPSGLSCFSSTTEYEVQAEGKKIVGSAQRRMDGKILQHGSILLGPYHRRIVEYLHVPSEQAEAMKQMLIQKTTDVSHYTADTASLKEILRAAFLTSEWAQEPIES